MGASSRSTAGWGGRWTVSATVSSKQIAWGVLVAIAGLVGGPWVSRTFDLQGTRWKIAVGFLLSTVGWVGTNVHLGLFDRWYLKWGQKRD